jgi:5'-nucleotidase/UDP-sugar diphosphatase
VFFKRENLQHIGVEIPMPTRSTRSGPMSALAAIALLLFAACSQAVRPQPATTPAAASGSPAQAAGAQAPAVHPVPAPPQTIPANLFSLNSEPSDPRNRAPLTLLQINDVYTTVPVNGIGGLARVATIKQQLQASGRTPFLVIAGDFLSPSVASSIFKGEQMVAAFNAMGLDLATFGNHEFDFGIDILLQRMKESKWQWVASNVVDDSGQPIGGASAYVVKTFGSLKVGFIGLVLITEQISEERLGGVRLLDPFEAAAKNLAILRQQNVDVIVALTHLNIADDRRLVERFPEIDVVIGGHEHYPIVVTANRTLISKAGSDARFVARIDINKPDAVVERHFQLIPVSAAIPDDPRTADVVNSFERRLGSELDAVVATSTVDLDAEELRLRAGETNLGDLFADAIRASVNADVGIMNSGSIRGDRIYEAGAITRRTLIAMHPFGNAVTKAELSGRLLLEALTFGVSKLPATAGHFPQISGMTMTVDLTVPASERVKNVVVNGTPLDLNATYTVALPDYVLGGGDGYSMLKQATVLVTGEAGELMVSAVEKYLSSRGAFTAALDKRITIIRKVN